MRNIDASKWLTEPRLGVIQAIENKDGRKGSKFTLNVKEVIEGGAADAEQDGQLAKRKPKTAAKRGKAGKKP